MRGEGGEEEVIRREQEENYTGDALSIFGFILLGWQLRNVCLTYTFTCCIASLLHDNIAKSLLTVGIALRF